MSVVNCGVDEKHNSKTSNADPQIRFTLLQSVGLNELLSSEFISAGVLSVFSVAAVWGAEFAYANPLPVSTPLSALSVEVEPATQASTNTETSQDWGELNSHLGDKNSLAQDEQQVSSEIPSGEVLPQHFATVSVMPSPAAVQFTLPPNASVPISTFPPLDGAKLQIAPRSPHTKTIVVGESLPKNAIASTPNQSVVPKLQDNAALLSQSEAGVEGNYPTAGQPTSVFVPLGAKAQDSVIVPTPPRRFVENSSPSQPVPTVTSLSTTTQSLGPVEPRHLAQAAGEAEDLPTSVQSNPLAPSLILQGVLLNQGDTSARARLRGTYPVSPHALFGATVDLTTGDDFADTESVGLDLNELYFTGSLPSLPNLRLVVGQLDLTSYFDRNSFAKDSTTHFFNPVFQTNPALAAAGIGSRPALLLNWNVTDNVEAKATAFSSARNLGDLDLDAFAGEVGVRVGTAIIRGTYVSARDARRDGFEEIFQIERGKTFSVLNLTIGRMPLGLMLRCLCRRSIWGYLLAMAGTKTARWMRVEILTAWVSISWIYSCPAIAWEWVTVGGCQIATAAGNGVGRFLMSGRHFMIFAFLPISGRG